MAEDQPNGLMAGLQNLFNSSDYSDLTIRCEEREWKVHRAIICPQSKFFAVACNGDFKVNSAPESIPIRLSCSYREAVTPVP